MIFFTTAVVFALRFLKFLIAQMFDTLKLLLIIREPFLGFFVCEGKLRTRGGGGGGGGPPYRTEAFFFLVFGF